MKRFLVVAVLVIVALAACQLPVSNPFLGSWTYMGLVSLTFSEDLVVLSSISGESLSGAYSYDRDTLTIRWSDGSTEIMSYCFPDPHVLELSWESGYSATFIRQQ